MNAKRAKNFFRPHFIAPTSIRARMTLGFAFFIAFFMLFFCVVFYYSTKRSERIAIDEILSRTAQEVQQDIAEGDIPLEGETPTHLGGEAPTHHVQPAAERWQLSKFSSEVSHSLAILVIDRSDHIIERSSGVIPTWPLHGDAWRFTTVEAGNRRIVLALPWYQTERELRERTLLLLALSALVVTATAGGAWFLVGRTLSPIDQLARQAQTASTVVLSTRLQPPSPDAEIARLVETLNDLLARWGETARSRERFYAAAAHELRTPLQALGGHLEVALSRERSADDYKMALVESRTQTERLTSLVQDLLLLNQLEAHTARPSNADFDLADLCESELRPLRALAQQRGLEITLDLPPHCEIKAPWNHATMLLRNLLENAVKYATTGGEVCVSLQNQTLTVCNDCAENVDTEKLFEPFFRPDISRTSSTGGNGLGLAICRSICEANAWQLTLQQHDKTLCATVCFGSRSV